MFPLEGDESGKGISKAEDPAKDANFKVNIRIWSIISNHVFLMRIFMLSLDKVRLSMG